jgi:hypothetical protein
MRKQLAPSAQNGASQVTRTCWLQAVDAYTRAGETAEADWARTQADEQQ